MAGSGSHYTSHAKAGNRAVWTTFRRSNRNYPHGHAGEVAESQALGTRAEAMSPNERFLWLT
jgi:hypothetical protein